MQHWLDWLPLVNALLVSTSGLFITAGWLFIQRRQVRRHRAMMVTATVLNACFLVAYVTRISLVGTTPFGGSGTARLAYLAVLGTHVPLATATVPLALLMFYYVGKKRFERHRRIGRILIPLWLYTSATGVVIYLMLYVWYPP